MTQRPHILPPPPGGGALRRADQPGAAFFDLDKTLIEGSSAIHFGRAAYKAGVLSRRQIAGDLWANVEYRLKGSTDEATEELRERILQAIAGQRVVDLARLSPEVLSTLLTRRARSQV